MNGKIARIEDLLAAGWDVEDMLSDEARIEVLLRKGALRQTIVLDTQDAWDVLYGDAFSGARAPRAALAVHP